MNRFFLSAFCVLSTPALAEALPFNPDRPGFADSTGVAPKGHVITEGGATFFAPAKQERVTVPDLLVRMGLTERLEARLLLPTYNRATFDSSDTVTGFGDAGIGAKFAFEAGPMAFGLVGTLTLPTGSDNYTADTVNGVLGLNFGTPLNDRMSLGGVVGVDLTKNGDDRVLGTFGSLSVGLGFDSAGLYVEAVAVRPDGGPVSKSANLGGTYALSASAQIDASFTLGLEDESHSGINVGTSWLW